MELFLSFILSTLISVLLIPLLIKSAGFLGMVDEPGERKVHQKAIPRCGGLGLAAAMLITVLLLLPLDTPYRGLILGGAIIVVFGALDDVLNLHYRWKFLGQFLAVLVVMQQGIYLDYLPFNGVEPAPKWIAYPITFLFVVGVTNAVNLSDGLDGLAAGIMLMTLALIAFFAADAGGGGLALMALALIGGILGFLRFNSHPAIVFMGDTGSQFIGFMVAFLSICLVSDVHVVLNPALPLLLLGLPVLDTLMVMTQRIALRLSPFSPDKRHIHHKLLAFGFTHAEAVACIYLLQSAFLVAAFCWRYQGDLLVIGGYLMICTVILGLFFGGEHLGWRLRDIETDFNRRRGFLRRFDGLYKGAKLYIEYALLLYLLVMILVMADRITVFSSRDQWLLMMVVALVGLVKKPMSNTLVKLSVYMTATFSGFVLTADELGVEHLDSVVNSFLAALMIVTFLGIRVTRRSVFTLSTQDMLISFFVLAVFLLADTRLPVGILFKLLCMAYATEYLLTFSLRRYRLLRFMAVVAGIMVLSLLIQDNTSPALDVAEQLNGQGAVVLPIS